MTDVERLVKPDRGAEYLQWLLDVSSIPTAAGREHRVMAWIDRWVSARPGFSVRRDAAGNMTIESRSLAACAGCGLAPLYLTAHMDHPAFVVERVISPSVVELSFRGGVMEDYFSRARVTIHGESGSRVGAAVIEKVESPVIGGGEARPSPFGHYLAELEAGADASALTLGDVATWDLPSAEVIDGVVHSPACDDLAAVAAALGALDTLAHEPTPGAAEVRLLFTRSEEIGFIGAIAACRDRTIPSGARVIALENSRAFADSPVGGGPIVRVGDRLSVFSASLTGAVSRRAEEVAGGPAAVAATQKNSARPGWKWQRKLMAGGACEASVFCDAGYEATCVCLPLGNYHNMSDLDAVQAGVNTDRPTIRREFIALSDYEGLIDLLVACGRGLGASAPVRPMVERLWAQRRFVIDL
ncbi:MAG: M20/M25/M40 family metallo-hydrolase [Phycisphaeraceae bacterium]|nr:M20/M25/M40 family metallo-hydrolase [Phycisphaerae bacterium]MBX3391788.1 M20/M25/M40 family metallo-hydrolase [Phycisphaeraceae bacterium]